MSGHFFSVPWVMLRKYWQTIIETRFRKLVNPVDMARKETYDKLAQEYREAVESEKVKDNAPDIGRS